MLSDSGTRMRDGALQLRLIGLRERLQLRNHELIDEIEHARVLFDRRLGMYFRNSRGIEDFAHLGQQARQLIQAGTNIAQALGQRREIARHQQIDTVAGKLRVEQRVPAPLLQLLGAPDLVFELIRQKLRIYLIRT